MKVESRTDHLKESVVDTKKLPFDTFDKGKPQSPRPDPPTPPGKQKSKGAK